MDQNPLIDLIANAKQQKLDADIQNIKTGIQTIMKEGIYMDKFIEITVLTNALGTSTNKVSINPKYIAYIEEDDSHAFVHMSTGSILHTAESRAEIFKLIEGAEHQTYIG